MKIEFFKRQRTYCPFRCAQKQSASHTEMTSQKGPALIHCDETHSDFRPILQCSSISCGVITIKSTFVLTNENFVTNTSLWTPWEVVSVLWDESNGPRYRCDMGNSLTMVNVWSKAIKVPFIFVIPFDVCLYPVWTNQHYIAAFLVLSIFHLNDVNLQWKTLALK